MKQWEYNTMITISIIVPVYNTEQYLPRCLESILSQSFTDFELLLVDDGSIDGSGQICDAYAEKDNRIRVFHKENGGVSSARNLGLDNAIGEWVCFVDSDDSMNEVLLEHFMNKSFKADLTYYSFNYIDEVEHKDCSERFENCLIKGRYAIESFVQPIRYRSYKSCIVDVPWGKFFQKSIIDEHHLRFPEDIDFKEDEIFNYRYLRYVEILEICDFIGYNYRILPNSLARRDFSNELLYNLVQHWVEEADNFGNNLKTDILQRACEYLMKLTYKVPAIKQKHDFAYQLLSINAQNPVHLQHIAYVASKFGVPIGSVMLVGLVGLGKIKRQLKKA